MGITIEELRARNPEIEPARLRPGMKVQYRKASTDCVTFGWTPFDAGTIAQAYNGGGDPLYAKNLDFVKNDILPKLKR